MTAEYKLDALTFNEYSAKAHSTAEYPEPEKFHYLSMGLSETIEVAGKLKHLWRDKGINEWDKIPMVDKLKLAGELGDSLWYINEMAISLGFSLAIIANMNNNKLEDRAKRGVISGSGDER